MGDLWRDACASPPAPPGICRFGPSTGFDDCIVGITEEFGNGNRVLYSKEKIIQKLMEDMSEEEAYEYFDYNIIGGYFGEQNPVFLSKLFHLLSPPK